MNIAYFPKFLVVFFFVVKVYTRDPSVALLRTGNREHMHMPIYQSVINAQTCLLFN
jgi:hypothetical protein